MAEGRRGGLYKSVQEVILEQLGNSEGEYEFVCGGSSKSGQLFMGSFQTAER